MKYVSLIVSEDAAHSCVSSLGELGALQLTDLNPEQTPFQRRYVGYMKRCDELERKIRYIEKEVTAFGLEESDSDGLPSQQQSSLRGAALLDALETDLEKYEEQLMELTNYSKELNDRYNEKVEFQECLEKARGFFSEESAAPNVSNPLLGEPLLEEAPMMRFSSCVGVVSATERTRFERMLFRSSRGNCLVRFAEIEHAIADAVTGVPEKKLVFVVFYKSEVIGQLVDRVCSAFGARRYEIPRSTGWDAAVVDTKNQLADAREVLLKNRELRLALCARLAGSLGGWRSSVAREKAVYHALNMFKADVSGVLRGEGWIVSELEGEARALVTRAHAQLSLDGAASMLTTGTTQTAPTYFETNSFTLAYQEFVNTYGVPRYKEINPALFTAFTFPFVFGIMYGDIGHGTCIFLAGLFLIYQGESGEFAIGRYMLTMMGACAIYCGLIYNDCFALALDLFGSTYEFDDESSTRLSENPYQFGVDPAWHVSTNELLFFNSMKMKTAVIFGICQMTLGICLKGVNAVYFKDKVALLLEFLPMLVFDLALFGYMVILIFTKWAIDWDDRMNKGTCDPDTLKLYPFQPDSKDCTLDMPLKDKCVLDFGGETNGCAPPNLINQLINIALNPGSVDEPMYQGQAATQTFLLVVAFLCIPVILFGRPAFVYLQQSNHHGEQHADGRGGATIELVEEQLIEDDEAEEAEHSFTEVFIHQCIETIEFVLGMVSNTASYLRLWALSLAHSELATVFWEKTLRSAINTGNPFFIFIGYAIFATVTTAVLLAMDFLECFLHALRLHWVEFQNKFYKADGHKFTPFSFKDIAAK